MKSAVEETITADVAALQTILVTSERGIVTDPVTGGSMMVTRGAGVTSCAAQITASSSDHTSIPRMTAVKILMAVEVGLTLLKCLSVNLLLHVEHHFKWAKVNILKDLKLF